MNKRYPLMLFVLLLSSVQISPLLAAAEHAGHAAHTATAEKIWGTPSAANKAQRTVEIRMNDQMRFVPSVLDVQAGETVRLVFHNDGQLLHEFVMGHKAQLDAHAAMLLQQPGMSHAGMDMLHVEPGGQGELTWTFSRAGEVDFACLIAGHYQAGMVGKINVLN
jgi:uncharacterized cupredoxin-like copper-binding protein